MFEEFDFQQMWSGFREYLGEILIFLAALVLFVVLVFASSAADARPSDASVTILPDECSSRGQVVKMERLGYIGPLGKVSTKFIIRGDERFFILWQEGAPIAFEFDAVYNAGKHAVCMGPEVRVISVQSFITLYGAPLFKSRHPNHAGIPI
jgi:hypothetical protein